MRNFIFISPNFPANYKRFCRELKNNGFNVLGIGDCPYDDLDGELKGYLTEYYRVYSLKNYDEVYRAVALFSFKYGRPDFIESNNEYWLELDARLRTDFNVCSGFKSGDMGRIKCKSRMKEYYKKAGVVTARYCMATSLESCRKFIEEVGYPVIVKPDNGVGANDTYKLSSDGELVSFFQNMPPVEYIMEEFVEAEVNSYDAIINSKGEPVFETGNVTPFSIMDIVNTNDNSIYYIVNELAQVPHPRRRIFSAGPFSGQPDRAGRHPVRDARAERLRAPAGRRGRGHDPGVHEPRQGALPRHGQARRHARDRVRACAPARRVLLCEGHGPRQRQGLRHGGVLVRARQGLSRA